MPVVFDIVGFSREEDGFGNKWLIVKGVRSGDSRVW